MSHLRDAKVVKTIAEGHHCAELSEEACRYVLAGAELGLRRAVAEAAKYARKFRRARLRPEDIDLALADLNLSFLLRGLAKPVAARFVRADETHVELDREELDVREEAKAIVGKRLFRKRKVELSLDWLAIQGRWNPLLAAAPPLYSALPLPPSAASAPIVETDREGLVQYDYLASKGASKSTFLVKELNPNVLTKEAGDFFETFRKIVEEYFQAIDENIAELDFRRFYYGRLTSAVGHQD